MEHEQDEFMEKLSSGESVSDSEEDNPLVGEYFELEVGEGGYRSVFVERFLKDVKMYEVRRVGMWEGTLPPILIPPSTCVSIDDLVLPGNFGFPTVGIGGTVEVVRKGWFCPAVVLAVDGRRRLVEVIADGHQLWVGPMEMRIHQPIHKRKRAMMSYLRSKGLLPQDY